MNIKIVSDGTASGTQVVDAESGQPIQGVVRIEWIVDADGPGYATAKFEVVHVPVDVSSSRALKVRRR